MQKRVEPQGDLRAHRARAFRTFGRSLGRKKPGSLFQNARVVTLREPADGPARFDGTEDPLVDLKGLIEAGKITPVIDRTYPLSEVPEVIRYLEEGHAQGKVVITV